jgi:hypothetical protein
VRLSHGNPKYYTARVTLDGKEIEDFEWADEGRGEIMINVSNGKTTSFGNQDTVKKLRKGKVKIFFLK